ncbi:unnamed protein product [Clavelina lepadiformis]|uniref:Uncharacterized protein n=1 Tax=Clavelina lepadiformis TaxID=159417 RepID=A0ABP0FP28_CLALP
MKMFVGVGFLLALLVGQGLSFQCYDCRATILDPDASEEAETCYAPNLDKHLVNCLLDDQVHCSTSVEKWEESGIPFVTIKRQCSATYAEKTCSTSDSGHETCLYYCSKDGGRSDNGGGNSDNSGSLVQASLITPMLAIVGALALIFCSVIRNI